MNQRDIALASLWGRTYRAAVTPVPRTLLDEAALDDARNLIAATDPVTDIPSGALAEVDDVRGVIGHRVRDLGIVSRLDDLRELFSTPPGLLHFACHNTFSPATGSVVRMDGGPIRPDDLEQCKRRLSMVGANPLVFSTRAEPPERSTGSPRCLGGQPVHGRRRGGIHRNAMARPFRDGTDVRDVVLRCHRSPGVRPWRGLATSPAVGLAGSRGPHLARVHRLWQPGGESVWLSWHALRAIVSACLADGGHGSQGFHGLHGLSGLRGEERRGPGDRDRADVFEGHCACSAPR